MNAKKIACASLLMVLALRPAYADKKRDQPQNAPQQSPQAAKQQLQALTGRNRQQNSAPQQMPMGNVRRGQGRATNAQGGNINRSKSRSVQTEDISRSDRRSGRGRTESRSSRSRGPSPDAVSRVYNFHGRHRGGGRYVAGRLVGRYPNDRVYVNNHWYLWQAPPLAFFGLGEYGWVADDEGGSEYVENAEYAEAGEPVIVGEYPGYYVVEVNHSRRRVDREDFYRRYPRYTRAHELRSRGAVVNARGATSRSRGMTESRNTAAASTGVNRAKASRTNSAGGGGVIGGLSNALNARNTASGGGASTARGGKQPPVQTQKQDKKNH